MPSSDKFDTTTLHGLQQILQTCPESADSTEWLLRMFDGVAEVRKYWAERADQLTTVWSRYDAVVPTGCPEGMPIALARLLLLVMQMADLMQINLPRALEIYALYLDQRRQHDDPATMPRERFVQQVVAAEKAVPE